MAEKMNKKAILEEKKFCRKQIRKLIDEVMVETDQSIALSKYEEMRAYGDRVATLDAMYTKLVSDEFDRAVNKLFNNIMKGV